MCVLCPGRTPCHSLIQHMNEHTKNVTDFLAKVYSIYNIIRFSLVYVILSNFGVSESQTSGRTRATMRHLVALYVIGRYVQCFGMSSLALYIFCEMFTACVYIRRITERHTSEDIFIMSARTKKFIPEFKLFHQNIFAHENMTKNRFKCFAFVYDVLYGRDMVAAVTMWHVITFHEGGNSNYHSRRLKPNCWNGYSRKLEESCYTAQITIYTEWYRFKLPN